MGKEENKRWKEKYRKRQLKQQGSKQTAHAQRSRNKKAKPGKFPFQKVFLGIAAIVIIAAAYGIWQTYEAQKPPVIGGVSGTTTTQGAAPDFSLLDINGDSVSLSQFREKVIGIHFMAVGCGGQINEINQYQLTQLKSVCTSHCGDNSSAFLTVAVATCQNSALDQLRSAYGVTWALGNDYGDEVLDIVNKYIPYEIGDGTVVLIDKSFNVAQVYNSGVDAETLSAKIDQLAEA